MSTNVTLSCDSVFDILTRGPYPGDLPLNDESVADVELHLSACHECRSFAEALRPASQMFHEVMAEEELAGLPVFTCPLPMNEGAADAPAVTITPTPGTAPAMRPSAWMYVAMGCVSGLIFGCLIGYGVLTATATTNLANANGSPEAVDQTGNAYASQTSSVFDLHQLAIPASCDRTAVFTSHPVLEQHPEKAFDCCTRCHTSTGEEVIAPSTHTIAASCRACHTGVQQTPVKEVLQKTGFWAPVFQQPESIRKWVRLDARGLTDSIQTVTTQFELFAKTA